MTIKKKLTIAPCPVPVQSPRLCKDKVMLRYNLPQLISLSQGFIFKGKWPWSGVGLFSFPWDLLTSTLDLWSQFINLSLLVNVFSEFLEQWSSAYRLVRLLSQLDEVFPTNHCLISPWHSGISRYLLSVCGG
ncbi:hypothetical protein CHARACLAT_019174 [Characodon lateralis]|uniref:Uncharacterized protein n=1 Tax=Characodon lateralis TaxID=208331 RepID=A0ABU7EC99_9TELE|nr:hypothetical protein [Characodon lateralis]